jgi:hypothetical protein
MSEQRNCINCRWHTGRSSLMICEAPQNLVRREVEQLQVINPSIEIATLTSHRWTYCRQHRAASRLTALLMRKCGAEGRWWSSQSAAPGSIG